MHPVLAHIDNGVVDDEVDVEDDICGEVGREAVGSAGLQLLEHELGQQQFV
jgi:hypothetical protein